MLTAADISYNKIPANYLAKPNQNMKPLKSYNIAWYFIKLAHQVSRGYLITVVFACVFKIVFPFINIIIPRYIIEELLGSKNINVISRYVILMLALNLICYLVNRIMEEMIIIKNEKLMHDIELELGKRLMNTEYHNLEDAHFLDLQEKALFPLLRQNILTKMFEDMSAAITALITLIGLMALISTLNIIIIIMIILTSCLYIFTYKKMQVNTFAFHQKLIPLNRKFTYYIHLVTDYKRAKDVRLYDMEKLISKKVENYNKESYDMILNSAKRNGNYSMIGQVTQILQMLLSYGYITIMTINKLISIGQFTMYLAAVNQFVNNSNLLIKKYIDFAQDCSYLENYIIMKKMCSNIKDEGIEAPDEIERIEFKNVSFNYPNSKQLILNNVSICLDRGDKVGIVGLNGAGKTTFVKLLSGLYEPTSGEILINGINLTNYKKSSYISKIATVFQDFSLLAFSIKDNIALENADKESDEYIQRILKEVALFEKEESSSYDIHTNLGRAFNESGMELSGGQRQKIAIARMFYKNAQIMLLDEPTAALDPIAEHEIYEQINSIIKEDGRKSLSTIDIESTKEGNEYKTENSKIVLFVSHRMSSCRFCDTVLVFDKGNIVEKGSHDELIRNDLLYKRMWDAQAQYYV